MCPGSCPGSAAMQAAGFTPMCPGSCPGSAAMQAVGFTLSFSGGGVVRPSPAKYIFDVFAGI